ncbi:MAG: rhodanese-like domain-containing protein [Betaproteobacteria bacterium]|nr:rhodanese-like domain-containing protein [Betaproteobacteria bacterium]
MLEFLIDNIVLVMAALTSGGLLLWPAIKGAQSGAQSVSVSEAVRLINREKGVLVDIRDAATFAAGHATGSRHVPLEQISLPTPSAALPSNKGLPVILLCDSGSRASKAATLLRKSGYERAVPVQGGMAAWREAQLPVEKSAA